MPLITVDEVVTEGHVRFFLQFGAEVGAAPTNELLYAGTDTQYLRIGAITNPRRGSITPINVPDPTRLKRYRRVGKTEEPPELPTFPVAFLQKHGNIPRQLYNLGDCPVTMYRVVGNCKDLSDFEKGWTDYVLVHSNAIATDTTLAGVGAFDSDDALEDEVTFVADAIYPVGRLNYDVELDEATYASVSTIDAVYGTPDTCAACREGTEHIYAVGTNGTAHNIYYSLDGGQTWNVSNLTTNAALTPTAIAVAGNNLIVTFGETASPGGYYLSVIDSNSGVPGTALKITQGVTSGDVLNDLFVLNARRVFFASDGGVIYKSVNLSNGVTVAESGSTVEDFTRIDGVRQSGGGSVMVAGTGTSGVVFYSLDDGETWSATADDAGGRVTAISVLSDRRIWVTTDIPELLFTADLGRTWETYSLPAPFGNILAFNDIDFATDEVGYIVTQVDKVGTAFVVYATVNGGFSWSTGESRFTQDLLIANATRITVPESDNIAVNANNLLIAGATDGLFIFTAGVR